MTAPQPEPPARLLLTVEDAADRLGIGRTLMYALVTAGEIESVTIGRLRRIPADALVTYVNRLRNAGDTVVAIHRISKPTDGTDDFGTDLRAA